MPDLSDSNKIVEDIIQHANAQLQAIPASPFSTNTFTILKEKIAQHIAELVTESIKVSRRYALTRFLLHTLNGRASILLPVPAGDYSGILEPSGGYSSAPPYQTFWP